MTINRLITRKHMFKNRNRNIIPRKYKLRIGTIGLFTIKPTRFEFVYLRKLKRLFRRRYIKAPLNFRRKKFWFFITANKILSNKATNSRMGAGVGSFVRICASLPTRKSFVEFRHYNFNWCRLIYPATKTRIPFKFICFRAIDQLYIYSGKSGISSF